MAFNPLLIQKKHWFDSKLHNFYDELWKVNKSYIGFNEIEA